jgi:hypothetical protein
MTATKQIPMKLTYTKVERVAPTACYIINIKYEHGDADSYTYNDVKLQNVSEEQLIRYLNRFADIQVSIGDHNDYGTPYNEELDAEIQFEGFPLPLEHDIHYDNNFAGMSIDSISYFDDSAVEFKVTGTYYLLKIYLGN